jgi:hypothetical protein
MKTFTAPTGRGGRSSIRESCLTRCPLLRTGRAWAASFDVYFSKWLGFGHSHLVAAADVTDDERVRVVFTDDRRPPEFVAPGDSIVLHVVVGTG